MRVADIGGGYRTALTWADSLRGSESWLVRRSRREFLESVGCRSVAIEGPLMHQESTDDVVLDRPQGRGGTRRDTDLRVDVLDVVVGSLR